MSTPTPKAAHPSTDDEANLGCVDFKESIEVGLRGSPGFLRRNQLHGVTRIACFFSLIGLLATALDAAIDYGLRRVPTSKFGSLNKIISGNVNAEIVVNGSSRALTHFDPRIIAAVTGKSAYTVGMNGVQIDVQLAMLKTYLKNNTRPKVVIQNLESFSFEATQKGEIYDPAVYVPYLGQNELYMQLRKIDPAVWKWKYIPLYGYTVEDTKFTWAWGLLGCMGIYGREDYFLGFNPRHVAWTEDFDRFRSSVGQGVTYRIDKKGVDALKEIIEVCRTLQIELVLVYSPEYYEMQVLERNRADVFNYFKRLCAEYEVPFWDYSDSPICRQRENFYNSQHLNAKGAELFSTDFAKRLKSLLGSLHPGAVGVH